MENQIGGSVDDTEIALSNLILDIELVEELEDQLSQFNIFEVLQSVKSEIKHSNILAWLLDPHGNHGLGDRFLRRFLHRVVQAASSEQTSIGPVEVATFDLDDVTVERERWHIDVLAHCPKNQIVLVLENKIHSMESEKQLTRYAWSWTR